MTYPLFWTSYFLILVLYIDCDTNKDIYDMEVFFSLFLLSFYFHSCIVPEILRICYSFHCLLTSKFNLLIHETFSYKKRRYTIGIRIIPTSSYD